VNEITGGEGTGPSKKPSGARKGFDRLRHEGWERDRATRRVEDIDEREARHLKRNAEREEAWKREEKTRVRAEQSRKREARCLNFDAKREKDTIKEYLGTGDNKPSGEAYIASVKKALGILSSDTLDEYNEKGVTFVVNKDLSYPKAREITAGKWEFHLPANYDYPHGMMLRCIDGILTTELKSAKDVTADPKRRAEIAARAFLTNMKLGEKYGWNSEHYELAKPYEEDYYHGIREAFQSGSIGKNTSKDDLIQIGHEYAAGKLVERTQPTEDVPRIFLSTLPGSYFEEIERFNKMERKIQSSDKMIEVKEPVKVGTDKYRELMEVLDARLREGGAKSTLKVVVLPNKEIRVLPYRFSGEEKSQHSIAGKGNPCVWAGEVDIDIQTKIAKLKGDSGHYRTYDVDEIQQAINEFALSAFQQQGYRPIIEKKEEK
jgi:hypothetical protein